MTPAYSGRFLGRTTFLVETNGRDRGIPYLYPVFPASTPNFDQKLDLLAVTIVQGQLSPAQKKTDQGEKTPKTDRFALNTASRWSTKLFHVDNYGILVNVPLTIHVGGSRGFVEVDNVINVINAEVDS